jgi:hypothetical protein
VRALKTNIIQREEEDMKKYVWGLAAIAIMVIGFALPSQAASFKVGDTDWTLGGSARLDVGWRSQDLGEARKEFEIGAADKLKDFFLTVPSNTRIFAKAVNGNLTGYTELGLSPGNADWGIDAEVKVRHVYLGYDMGGGNSLLLGQTWTCVAEDSPNQRLFDDNGLMGVGDLYLGRHPQIRFIHTQDKMTFQVAIEDNRAITPEEVGQALDDFTGGYLSGLLATEPSYLVEDTTPGIALSLSYDGGSFLITPSLYAQQYKLKADELNPDTGEAAEGVDDIKVTSYVLALDGALKFEGLTLSGEAWWGQNVALIAYITNGGNPVFGLTVPDIESVNFDIKDIKSYGGWLQLAAPLKPGTLYVGAGYQKAESGVDIVEGSIDDYTAMGFFINYEYPIVKNFTMTPEVAYYDYGKLKGSAVIEGDGGTNVDWDLELGKDWFFGVHFQYDF